jgi:hypothetical protein
LGVMASSPDDLNRDRIFLWCSGCRLRLRQRLLLLRDQEHLNTSYIFFGPRRGWSRSLWRQIGALKIQSLVSEISNFQNLNLVPGRTAAVGGLRACGL